MKRVLPRLKKSLKQLVAIILVLVIVMGVWVKYFAQGAEAAWFDENWRYRTLLTLPTHASAENNVFVTITLDTATLISAGKLQSDCDDLRFTLQNGKLLTYYLQGTCNQADTLLKIKFDTYESGNVPLYYYYGNPAAAPGSVNAGFGSSASNNSTTINLQVASANDDGADVAGSGTFRTTGNPDDGTPWSITSYMTTGGKDAGGIAITAGLRFTNATIPQAATITAASFDLRNEFVAGSPGYGTNVKNLVYASKQTNVSSSFSNANLPRNITRTTASATWNSASEAMTLDTWFSATSSNQPPSITSLIQEVVNQTGWTSGNALALIFVDNGSTTDWWFQPRGYESGAANAGKLAATFQLLSATAGTEEKAAQPLAFWRFDEGVGTTSKDSTTNNHTVTFGASTAAPTWNGDASCISGKCLKFDGSNDYASTSVNLSATSAVTVSFWMKWKAYADDDSLAMELTANTNGGTTGFFVDPNGSDGYFGVTVRGDGGYNSVSFARPKAGWHHFSFVLDKSQSAATEIIPYVDGVAVSYTKSNSSNNTNTFASDTLYFMSRAGSSLIGGGLLDEVKLYPYARTAAQVKADATASSAKGGAVLGSQFNSAQVGGIHYGITHYYKFDESSWTNDCSTKSIKDSAGSADLLSCPASTGPTTPGVGRYGNAGSFDGTNDIIGTDATDYAETYGKRWTAAVWFKTSDTQGYILDTRGTGNLGQNGVAVFTDGADTFTFFQNISNTARKSYTYTSTSLDNTWHHLLVTRDEDNSISFYIDKVKLSPTTQTTNLDISSLNEVWYGISFGNRYTGNVYALSGSIDEARLYSRAFSQNDVNNLYEYGPTPVGYWDFEERSGTTIIDKSGNGNTGTATNGPIWTRGKVGSALQYDGTDDYVALGTSSVYKSAQGTWSFWYYPRVAEDYRAVVTFSDDNGDYNDVFALRYMANQSISMTNRNGSEAYPYRWEGGSDPNTVPLYTWSYVTLVQDGVAAKLYVNGVLVKTMANGSTANDQTAWTSAQTSATSLRIGYPSGSGHISGVMDDFKVYNYGRSSKQIVEDMNGGHPAGGSPVGSQLAYWTMDQGYGTTAFDKTPNRKDLTLSAASWTNNGKMGKAFDGGDNKRLSRADDSAFDFTASEDMSISMWFKSDSSTNPSANEYLLSKLPSGASNGGYALYSSSSGGNICFGIDDDNTSFPEDSVCSTADLYDTTWHQIIARKTGTSRLDLYIDGKADGTPDTSLSSISNTLENTSTFYVGDANGTDGTDEFLGDIDEVKIYRSALSENEIKIDLNRNASQLLGSLGTDASGNPSNASDRAYCPPGDTTATCGPIAEWNFEEGNGTTTNDISGNSNTGTFGAGTAAPQWSLGKIGRGVSFDGSNDYIDITDSTSLSPTSALTVSGWFYQNSLSGDRALISKLNVQKSWELATESSNNTQLIVYINGQTIYGQTASNTWSANTWHHVTFVYNGAATGNAERLKVYVNGVKKTLTFTGTIPASLTDSNAVVRIGAVGDGSAFWNGKSDNIRMYNYARSDAQVAWDYSRGAPIAHWKMDECQGETLYDSSGNGFTGTITTAGGGTNTAGSTGACTTSSTTSPRYTGASGKFNSSVHLDGGSDHVDIAGTVPGGNSSGTFSAWFRALDNRQAILVYNCGTCGGNGFGAQDEIHIHLLSDGSVGLFVSRGSSSGHSIASTAVSSGGYNYADSSWHMLTGTWDTSGSILSTRLYIDGKLVTTGSTTLLSAFDFVVNGGNLGSISTGGAAGGSVLNGQIDDARMYNYALTANQVKTLYNGAAVRFGPQTGTP